MKNNLVLILVLLLLACATQISSDIYIPSLLSISQELEGATFNLAQLSVSIFLFGVCISQLISGPISEVYGRKRVLLVGLSVMSVGSIICLMASSVMHLLVGRVIQGLGGGALAALWRTVFRDHMSGTDLAKYGSYISILMISMVSIAPVLGGYFEQISWRVSFLFMLFYTLISGMVVYFLYHSDHSSQHELKWEQVAQSFKTLLASPIFMGVSVVVFVCYGSLFSWIVMAPSLLMYRMQLSAEAFGWVMALTSLVGYFSAAIFNAKLVKSWGQEYMMKFGFGLMLLSGGSMVLSYYLLGESVLSVLVPIVIFYFGSALIWPNAFSLAFTPFGHIGGYAGSLYGLMQMGGGAMLGSVASLLSEHDQRVLGGIILFISILAYAIFAAVVVPKISKD